MKTAASFLVTFLSIGAATIVSASAGDRPLVSTGTAYEVGRQYAEGGPFAGVSSRHTGTVLEVARDSLKFLGSPDRLAADWRTPPIVAQGD